MGIFDKVFKLFEKHEGHKELIETFSELNSIYFLFYYFA